MKKNLLKNMFTSICVTTFIVMIVFVISGYISNKIYRDSMINDAENFVQVQGTENELKETIESFEGENGVVEYQKTVIWLIFNGEKLVYDEIAYALVVSTIIGGIIGYLKTIMELRQDKKATTKKTFFTYLVGLAVVEAVVGIINIIEYELNSIDPGTFLAYGFNYTIIFGVYVLIKLGIDTKKKKQLNELMKKDK
ncbi:MAG: hypothetical protein IJH12_03210 [Clostridia bacterium]|nr:hypothetical protein [Clostridia bacterium]